MNTILLIGLILEFVGALLMVLPDIPYVKSIVSPDTLENARRELFDKASLTDGSKEFDALLEVVESRWDTELECRPSFFLIEKPGPRIEKSLFAVYDEDSEGPFGDLRTEDGYQNIPEGVC